ncbi:MAG: HAD hydrolase-like protein [Candidatus Omnitrophica bacterium]|nr:HAD hydrolase-like protein [Candidatus Omnitrophota bacterium]
MTLPRMIIFDIDGTLLLTGGVGIDAFNRAFQEMFGVSEIWDHYDPHGKTDYEIIRDLSKIAEINPSDSEAQELGRRYTKYFGALIGSASRFQLMPGVLGLLDALSSRKYFLGIATGNFKETADHKLERGKINHFFSFGGYGSDSEKRLELTRLSVERGLKLTGEKIKREEIVLIGDARQDMECGRTLGLRTIAVATGSLSEAELSQFKPDLLLKDLADSKQILSFIQN